VSGGGGYYLQTLRSVSVLYLNRVIPIQGPTREVSNMYMIEARRVQYLEVPDNMVYSYSITVYCLSCRLANDNQLTISQSPQEKFGTSRNYRRPPLLWDRMRFARGAFMNQTMPAVVPPHALAVIAVKKLAYINLQRPPRVSQQEHVVERRLDGELRCASGCYSWILLCGKKGQDYRL
jgi:hypothetical protein